MADGENPQPENAPAQAEALPSPSKKTERQLSRMEDQADMDRKLMRTRIDEMDHNIEDLKVEANKEKDAGKQARLNEQLAAKIADREQAYAEYKVQIQALDAKIAEIKKTLTAIAAVKNEIKVLENFVTANKDTLSAAMRTQLAEKNRELASKRKELEKLAPEGRENDLNATLRAYESEKRQINEDAERRKEIGQADRDLDQGMAAVALGEASPSTTPSTEGTPTKPDVTPPLTPEDKEVILDNKIDQMAFDLAKLLADNVPTENDTFGKFSFQAKRGLLMVLSFVGGDPVWVENLSTEQQKSLGMTVTTKTDEKGQTLHSIKWEALDLSLNKVKDVYEVAFGENGWTKEMGELTPTTTLKDLQDRVAAFPADTQDPAQLKMKAFVNALVQTGATPESGVQEYVIKNGDKIIKVLQPETTPPADETEPPKNEKIKASDFIEMITNNKFNESTKMMEVLKAMDPKINVDAVSMEGLTSEASIQAFSESFSALGKALAKLGMGDMSLSLAPTIATALTEIKDGKLSDTTKAELQKGVESYLSIEQKLGEQTFKAFLDQRKTESTDEDEKKEIDTLLAALKTPLNP